MNAPTQATSRFFLTLAAAPSVRAAAGGAARRLASKDAALLAWLAIEGATPRARLANLLWPDSDATAARNVLRQRLFQLQKLMGGNLVLGQNTLSLAPDCAHDLAQASVLLEGLGSDFEGELAQWLQQQRQRLRDTASQVLVVQADLAEKAADWPTGLSLAQQLLRLQPLSEDAHRRLMRLHYLAGDRAQALLAFDDCEKVLKNEVGTAPSPETLALLHTVERAAAAPAHSSAALSSARVPTSVLRPPRLVGRETAWAALEQAWAQGRSVIVTGEAGMGKTRFVSDFAASRERTLLVGARPGDARVIYASASRMLRQLPRDLIEQLPGDVKRELARLLPELGEANALASAEERTRFFNAVTAALALPAQGFDGVLFDDLHFADEASIELVQYLAASSSKRWLISARSLEVSSAGQALLADFALHGDAPSGVLHIALPPLNVAQIEELLISLALEGVRANDMAPTLARHTGGNPLYLLETIKAWWLQGAASHASAGQLAVAERPVFQAQKNALQRLPTAPSVAALIERRIDQLSSAAVQLARCAAVATPDFSIELASHVLGVRTLDLADPWTELEGAQVFRDGAFAHDLIFESALASVPTPVARQLHAEIAAYLAQRGGEPARIAAHWLEAGQDLPALAALMQAAQLAQRALRLQDEAHFLRQAAGIALRLGQHEQAYEALRQLLQTYSISDRQLINDELLDQLEDCAQTAQQQVNVLLVRTDVLRQRGQYAQCLQMGQKAAKQARAEGLESMAVEALRYAASAASFLGDSQHAVRLLRPMLPWVLAHGSTDEQQGFANDLACCLDNADAPAEAQEYHRRALALAQQTGRLQEAANVCGNLATSCRNSGRFKEALGWLERGRSFAHAYDAVAGSVWHLDLACLIVLRDLGQYSHALRAADTAQRSVMQHPPVKRVVLGNLACLWMHLGQHARAQRALNEAPVDDAPPFLQSRQLQVLARLQRALGQSYSATLDRAMAMAPASGRTLIVASVEIDHAWTLAPDVALSKCLQVRDRMHVLGFAGAELAATARAAGYAVQLGDATQALSLAKALMAAPADIEPDDMGRGEVWLAALQAFALAGKDKLARQAAADGAAWLERTCAEHVDAEFQDSFLRRNRVNAELMAAAQRWRSAQPKLLRS